jgi:hypothetical protein
MGDAGEPLRAISMITLTIILLLVLVPSARAVSLEMA